MKKFVLGLIFGGLIVGALAYHYGVKPHATTAVDARDGISNGAQQAEDAAKKGMDSLGLSVQDVKDDLARTGKVVWEKAQAAGKVVADDTKDARITTTIKGKLIGDSALSVFNISVSTTDGRVTLSGTASSAENIRKAMALASDTDGVREVVSTVQVK
jgi:osmotically-inducible protein OsmY